MKMSRRGSSGAVAVMIVGAVCCSAALAGCSAAPVATPVSTSRTSAAAGPVTLTMQVWGDTKFSEAHFDAYKAAFPAESANVTVKVQSAGANDADAISKLRLQLSSGQDIPDIVQMNYSALPEFADSGVLSDIAPLVTDYLPNITTAAQDLMKFKDTTVGFPYEVKEKLWFYRADMFAKAGIDPAQIKTQADFIAAGKKLRTTFPKSYIWNIASNPQQYQWGMVVSGNGAKYSTQEPCEIVVGSDPGVAAAFKAMKDLRESGVVDTKHDDFSTEWQSGLADGTIASTLGASWLPSFLQQYAPDLAGKWAVTTWPEIGGAMGGSEAGGSVFVIPAASQNKQAAADFLAKTFMTQEGATALLKVQPGYIPNVSAVLDTDPVKDNAYFGPSLVNAYLEASKTYKIFPFDPAANKQTTVLSAQLANYLNSPDAEPTKYLSAAQDQLVSQVGCPWER